MPFMSSLKAALRRIHHPSRNPSLMTKSFQLERAIRANNISNVLTILATSSDTAVTPGRALKLSAHHARPDVFAHLLTQYPYLTKSLLSESFLLKALSGDSIPIWTLILQYEPEAKHQCFGHFGTVVEHCVICKQKKLLRFLLEQGAEFGPTSLPILVQAECSEAGDDVKALLVKYGAEEHDRDWG